MDAFGTNVLDEDILSEVIPAAEFGESFVAPGALRLLGVEVGYRRFSDQLKWRERSIPGFDMTDYTH